MHRRIWYTLAGLLAFLGVALAQGTMREDPDPGSATWWRVFNQFGQSYGVSYGTTRPALPGPGEIFVDMDGDADGGAQIEIWDNVNAEWNTINDNDTTTFTIGTLNTVVKFAAADLADSSITDDGATVDFTVADITFTNAGRLTGDTQLILHASGSEEAILLQINSSSRLAIEDLSDLITLTPSGTTSEGAYAFSTSTANASTVDFTATLPVTAAGQTTNFVDLSLTNADHTGGTVNAFNVGAITGDAEATERGILVGDGYDSGIAINDSGLEIAGTGDDGSLKFTTTIGDATPAFRITRNAGSSVMDLTLDTAFEARWAGTGNSTANHNFIEFNYTAGTANGSDTSTALNIDIANANHTGTGNTVTAITIDAITGDAQAEEIGILLNAGFDLALDTAGSIRQDAYRQSFDAPCLKVEAADFTAELVTDAGVNQAICEGTPKVFLYRLDGAQSSPFVVVPGAYLDLDNDGISDEGVEVILSDLATSTQGWAVVGTSPAMYMRASVTMTSVSGTDNVYIGWRLAEAFVDNQVLATYDTYGVHVINDAVGNLQIQTGDDTVDATDENDQVAAFADAETHVFEVRVATAGTFLFFIDGLPVTQTNAVGAAAAGDVLYPVVAMLNAVDADTEFRVNYIEVGEVQ